MVHELADVAALERTAAALGCGLEAGDVVLLDGPIGIGKTHFVRACVEALGLDDAVTSPTYTLMHVYGSGRRRILHLDAYRLSGVDEYLDLGIEDLAGDAITMVEWGGKIAAAHPRHIRVVLGHGASGEGSRRCAIEGV